MKRLLLLSLLAIPTIGMDAPLPKQVPAAKQAPAAQEQEETECTICMDPISGGQTYSKTPCGHLFHYNCFNTFSVSAARYSCPNCRTQLTEETLALLRNAPTGTIKAAAAPAPIMAQAAAPFFDRVKNVFSPSLPVLPVNEVTQALMRKSAELKQLKQVNKALESHAEDLGDSKERLEENLRKEIARLVDKSKALERKLEEQKNLFEQNLRQAKTKIPEQAQLLALQDTIKALGKEKDALYIQISSISIKLENATNTNDNLRSLIKTLEEAKRGTENANRILMQRYNAMERQRDQKVTAALLLVDRLSTLRQRLVHLGSLGTAALSGYIAYQYFPNYPKTAAFIAGTTGLVSSYYLGARQIHRYHRQDLLEIQD